MVCRKDLWRPGDTLRTPEITRLRITSELSSNEKDKNEPKLRENKHVRVLLLGASGVGKSSLCCQFLSSENVNTYETETLARTEKCVVMAVNGELSNICFVDQPHGFHEVWSLWHDMMTWSDYLLMCRQNQVDQLLEKHNPDAVVVVMAVDDFSSYLLAQNIVEKLSRCESCKCI